MSNLTRGLSPEERAELDELNRSVESSIERRRLWLDSKMHECSLLKPGDEIFDIKTGRLLGVVSRLYRFHADQGNHLYDKSHYCEYEYNTGGRCFDNTSRQPGLRFGTREMAANHVQSQLVSLLSRSKP